MKNKSNKLLNFMSDTTHYNKVIFSGKKKVNVSVKQLSVR